MYGHGGSGQGGCLLAIAHLAVSGTRHSFDPPAPGRPIQRPGDCLPHRIGRGRGDAGPALRGTHAHCPAPAGRSVQPGRLPGYRCGDCSPWSGISPTSSRRTTSPSSIRRSTSRRKLGSPRGSSRPFDLAEQAFISEFAKLIEHLTERLSTTGDGERKIFRDSAITNLTEFFGRFRDLNVRSNDDLDALVERAQQIVSGVEPQALRNNAGCVSTSPPSSARCSRSSTACWLINRDGASFGHSPAPTETTMDLVIDAQGGIKCVYGEAIPLQRTWAK